MKNITVNKQQLVDTLRENARTHQDDFDIAWEAFRVRATENVEALLARLKDAPHGEPVQLWIGLEPPQNHVEDYQRAIEMCNWEVGDEMILPEFEFRTYVQDKWSWKDQFTAQNTLYTGSASPSSAAIE